MNKMTVKLLAILLAFVTVSCSSGGKKKNNSGDKAVASRQVKELPYFKRVILNGAFEVCYEQSDSLNVVVRGRRIACRRHPHSYQVGRSHIHRCRL